MENSSTEVGLPPENPVSLTDVSASQTEHPEDAPTMNERKARRVLNRFSRQIDHAARVAVDRFSPKVETDDAKQEASLLVLSYAGLVQGRLSGQLDRWTKFAGGDERRIRGFLGKQLMLDVQQVFGRQLEHDVTGVSLENLPPSREPSCSPEDGWIARIDQERYVRKEYPYLAMLALDEMTEAEMSAETGVPDRTIRRRLAEERRRAQHDPYFVQTRDEFHWVPCRDDTAYSQAA
jgi:hypothetical protein